LEEAPIPAKYYLSETYLKSLREHKRRNEAAGNGFGYVIRNLDGIAGALMCGGIGREKNFNHQQTEIFLGGVNCG